MHTRSVVLLLIVIYRWVSWPRVSRGTSRVVAFIVGIGFGCSVVLGNKRGANVGGGIGLPCDLLTGFPGVSSHGVLHMWPQ